MLEEYVNIECTLQRRLKLAPGGNLKQSMLK